MGLSTTTQFKIMTEKTKETKTWHIGQLVDHHGIIGTISAITADRTGKQETVIIRFKFNRNSTKEVKVNDPALNPSEIIGGLMTPNWLTHEGGDVWNCSDKD